VAMRVVPGDVSGLAALGLVTGGGTHSCALTAGGGVRCWGGNLERADWRRHAAQPTIADRADRHGDGVTRPRQETIRAP
jgi:hypothetical protein